MRPLLPKIPHLLKKQRIYKKWVVRCKSNFNSTSYASDSWIPPFTNTISDAIMFGIIECVYTRMHLTVLDIAVSGIVFNHWMCVDPYASNGSEHNCVGNCVVKLWIQILLTLHLWCLGADNNPRGDPSLEWYSQQPRAQAISTASPPSWDHPPETRPPCGRCRSRCWCHVWEISWGLWWAFGPVFSGNSVVVKIGKDWRRESQLLKRVETGGGGGEGGERKLVPFFCGFIMSRLIGSEYRDLWYLVNWVYKEVWLLK